MPKIIAGEFRSRSLRTIPGSELTRPMLSRVKESVFGMLHEWFDGARVLDLFAGIGTVGLEAVSRGASAVLMVERDARVFGVLQRNIDTLECGDRAQAMLADALAQTCLMRAPQPVDLVFVDPPYAMMHEEASRQRILDQITRCRPIMGDKGFIVLRSPLGPSDIDLSIEAFTGPEPHRYRKDMWTLFYEPAETLACSDQDDPGPP
ncbi:MAG: 16S rRNA (guanine(966)-N(2))-methyltransferase RsmD [Planctomycetes bacterium]|nr:16S rRNA (guanine(966)-N(2))-methyltransferase RsmD [Planctomycetota bacterium]MCH8210786.1 16S rRNA (guanine(966)-N(2))-methyltransferase RsmD [Planctomycetota bacterium]MCH8260215.1 16S rRNA (guanine(966)-N(2))-methyltransferase RsmD [Planctomycetota bacterium]